MPKAVGWGPPGLHFYTLNLEKVAVGILRGLELVTPEQAALCQVGDADSRTMVSAQGITSDKAK